MKNNREYQVPTYEEFTRLLMPYAKKIAKSQNLPNATFPDIERAIMAIDEAYIKLDSYDPNRGVKFTSYFYTILRNELCTIQSYDKDRVCEKSKKDDEEESPAIIKSATKFKDVDLENFNPAESMLEEEYDEDSCFESMEEFVRRSEYLDGQLAVDNCDPYDENDCFVQSFTMALKEFPKSDQLILTGNKREYVRVKGALHADPQAWQDFFSNNKGTIVFKGISRAQIGEILNYTADNVGYIKNKRAEKLAIQMSGIFQKIYLGPDPKGTFRRMLGRYKSGRIILNKNNMTL